MTSGKNRNLTLMIGGVVALLVVLVVVFAMLRTDSPTERTTRPAAEVVDRPETTPDRQPGETRVTPAPVRTPAPARTTGAPLTVTVIDAGSRDPIPQTQVWLAQGTNRAYEGETNAQGIFAFEDVEPGDYALFAQWGPGVEHPGGNVAIAAGESLQRIVEYPARTRFTFRFTLEESEQPAAGREITINLPKTEVLIPEPGFELKATTDAAGRLRFWAYPDLRPVYFSTDGIAQFTRENETRWLNPYDYRAPLGFEEEGNMRIRENVVQVVGRLVNPPAVPFGQGFVVNALSPRADYRGLSVIDNQFQFTAAPGAVYNISLVRPGPDFRPENAGGATERLQALTNASVEKRMEITLPETAGIYNFDIEFEDRRRIRGRVLNADGSPAPGQLVRARGFSSDSDSTVYADVRVGRGLSDFLSEPTDGTGQFSVDVPQADEYTFMISTLNPVQDARRMDSVTWPWERLASGEEVILQIAQPAVMWGYVVDEDENPVARASVTLRGARLPPAWERFGVATDEEGFFMMELPDSDALQAEGVSLGDIYAQAHRPNQGRGLAPVVVNDPDTPVKITMFGTTMVRIRANNGDEFVNRLNVSFLFDAPEFATEIYGGGTRTMTGRRGLFQLQNVPKGVTTLAVSNFDDPDSPIIEIPIPATSSALYERRIDFKNP